MAETEEWRPGSFTKNFSWGRDQQGLRELYDTIRIGFDEHVQDVPREVFRERVKGRGRPDYIPINFFLFNVPREDEAHIVADELVFQAITSDHSERFDKLALFAFLISYAGRWKGAMRAQRRPALWAKAYVQERVAGRGGWDTSVVNSRDISNFVANDHRYTGETTGKLASNLNFILEKGDLKGFAQRRIERWWVDCLFLALDRIVEDRRLDRRQTSPSDFARLLEADGFLDLTGGATLEKRLAIKHLTLLYTACGGRNRFSEELVIERTKELLPDADPLLPNDPSPGGAVHLTNPRILKSIPQVCALLARYAGFVTISPVELEHFDLEDFIRRHTETALESLQARGIKPSMTAEELMRMTREG